METKSRPGHPLFHELLERMRALHIKKQQDYGSDDDPLGNMHNAANMGMEPWRAAWLRILDKVHRMNEYCKKGSLANEGIIDTLLDIGNYALLQLILMDEAGLVRIGSEDFSEINKTLKDIARGGVGHCAKTVQAGQPISPSECCHRCKNFTVSGSITFDYGHVGSTVRLCSDCLHLVRKATHL